MPVFWTDYAGRSIRVNDERLTHAFEHEELLGQGERIQETLRDPDIVVQSHRDPEVSWYHKHYSATPVGGKYLRVVVKSTTQDAFLLTAFYTDRVSRGITLWEKK
jgi:hypothetical protein